MRSLFVVVALVVMVGFVSASVDDFLGKKYTLDKDDGKFVDILKALGVGFVTRNAARFTSPTISVVKAADKPGYYTLKTESTFKNYQATFKPGEEFNYTTADDRAVKYTVTFDGNKMFEKQVNVEGGEILNVEREFSPNEMKVKMTVGDVVCNRTYKLVN